MQSLCLISPIVRRGNRNAFVALILLFSFIEGFADDDSLSGVKTQRSTFRNITRFYVEYSAAYPPPLWAVENGSAPSVKGVFRSKLWVSDDKYRLETESALVAKDSPFQTTVKEVVVDVGGQKRSLSEEMADAERLQGSLEHSSDTAHDIISRDILGTDYTNVTLADPASATNAMRNGKYHIRLISESGCKELITVDPERGGFATRIVKVYPEGFSIVGPDKEITEVRLKQWGKDKRWFPSELRRYDIKDGKRRLGKEVTVTEVVFDPEFPPGIFELEFPPGTEVDDEILDKEYIAQQ